MESRGRIIELDAGQWRTIDDCYTALMRVLGSPQGHGRNLNAFIDPMIWGGINAVQPPYAVHISGTNQVPADLREDLEDLQRFLAQSREEYRARNGRDVEVSLEID